MAEAIKAKNVTDKAAQRAARKAARRSRRAVRDAKTTMDGKLFADLTTEEKDTLLKALAIQAGLIEE